MNNRYEFLVECIKEILDTDAVGMHGRWRNLSGEKVFTIVDCGCGDGHGSSILARVPEWDVHAFDFDVDRVKDACQSGINAKQGDVRRLELPSLFADIYVCSETLEHLTREDSILAAQDIQRVTKRPGFIVVTVPADKKICLANKKHKQYLSVSDLEEIFGDDCLKIYEGQYCKSPGRCNTVVIFRNLI